MAEEAEGSISPSEGSGSLAEFSMLSSFSSIGAEILISGSSSNGLGPSSSKISSFPLPERLQGVI